MYSWWQRLVSAFVVVLCFFAHGFLYASNSLENIRFGQHREKARVVFDVRHAPQFNVAYDEAQRQLIVDLQDTQPGFSLDRLVLTNSLFQKVYGSQLSGNVFRVVLQLSQPVTFRSYRYQPRGSYGDRVMISLTPQGSVAGMFTAPLNKSYPMRSSIKNRKRQQVVSDSGYSDWVDSVVYYPNRKTAIFDSETVVSSYDVQDSGRVVSRSDASRFSVITDQGLSLTCRLPINDLSALRQQANIDATCETLDTPSRMVFLKCGVTSEYGAVSLSCRSVDSVHVEPPMDEQLEHGRLISQSYVPPGKAASQHYDPVNTCGPGYVHRPPEPMTVQVRESDLDGSFVDQEDDSVADEVVDSDVEK